MQCSDVLTVISKAPGGFFDGSVRRKEIANSGRKSRITVEAVLNPVTNVFPSVTHIFTTIYYVLSPVAHAAVPSSIAHVFPAIADIFSTITYIFSAVPNILPLIPNGGGTPIRGAGSRPLPGIDGSRRESNGETNPKS
jgi:hypothetical protein